MEDAPRLGSTSGFGMCHNWRHHGVRTSACEALIGVLGFLLRHHHFHIAFRRRFYWRRCDGRVARDVGGGVGGALVCTLLVADQTGAVHWWRVGGSGRGRQCVYGGFAGADPLADEANRIWTACDRVRRDGDSRRSDEFLYAPNSCCVQYGCRSSRRRRRHDASLPTAGLLPGKIKVQKFS